MTGKITVTAVTVGTTEFQMGYGLADSTSDASGSSIQQTMERGFITKGYGTGDTLNRVQA